jgi:hypothetical protein
MIKPELTKVEFVSCGSIAQIEEAWRTSRPNDNSSTFSDIMKMDVPVNEFLSINFTAFAPILMRELICTQRNHVVWARSSRVDDLTYWPVWHGISGETFGQVLELQEKMFDEMKNAHQDDFRRHLPVCYMTTFSFSMTFRDLTKFMIGCFDFDHPIVREFALATIAAIKNKLEVFGGWLEKAVEERYYKPFPLFPKFTNFESGTIGDFVVISSNMSLSLRSQAIRHRAIVFRDNFESMFEKGRLGSSMETKVSTQMLMSRDFAEELARKRSCWIAQTDLWLPVVTEIQKVIGAPERPLLPCDDGRCRFKVDNDLRKDRKDPSPPCPIAAKINRDSFKEYAKEASDYASRRPNFPFWSKEISDVL